MHETAKQHFLIQIDARMAERNWTALPQQFEIDAVRMFYLNRLKDHFSKQAIKARITASKATNWAELRAALVNA